MTDTPPALSKYTITAVFGQSLTSTPGARVEIGGQTTAELLAAADKECPAGMKLLAIHAQAPPSGAYTVAQRPVCPNDGAIAWHPSVVRYIGLKD